MPSSGAIAADARAVPNASGAERRRTARHRSPGASRPCHSHSENAGAPASWTRKPRPLGDSASGTRTEAVITGPVEGSR